MKTNAYDYSKGAAQENLNLSKKHKCSITGETYYGFGNNAWPYEGRCSDKANSLYVIPARLCGVTPEQIKNAGGNILFRKQWDSIPQLVSFSKQFSSDYMNAYK